MFKKILALICKILFITTFVSGVLMLPLNGIAAIVVGIIVICISLASGMLLPNPISLLSLIVGILMLFIPCWIIGIVLMCLGLVGTLITFLVSRKVSKTA